MILDALKRLFGRTPGDDGVTCEEALKKMYEFMDGELDSVTAEQVERHFEMCRRCYPHLVLEERFQDRIKRALRRDSCPDRVREKVLESLEREEG